LYSNFIESIIHCVIKESLIIKNDVAIYILLYYSPYFDNLIFKSLLLSWLFSALFCLLFVTNRVIQFVINKKLCELKEECIRDVHMICQLPNLLNKRLIYRVSAFLPRARVCVPLLANSHGVHTSV